MTFLRNIWADLVEKRLWPVAVVLLAGTIAVPVVFGKKAVDEPLPPAPVAGASAAGSDALVALDTSAGKVRVSKTAVNRNPFKQLFVPKPQEEDTTQEAPATKSADSGSSGSQGSGSGDSGGTQTTPQDTKPEKKPSLASYKVTLRFGQAGSMRTIRNIARLTPLPSVSDPFFVFLGVRDKGARVVFLISSDVTATGDGTCRPRKSNCETIELGEGDTEFFDLKTETGTEQYQMDIVRISKTTATSAGAAAKARARTSRAGAALLELAREDDEAPAALGAYRWDVDRGVLLPRAGAKDEGSKDEPASGG
jgi:hypothetical protein